MQDLLAKLPKDEVSAVMRALSLQRHRVEKPCAICGTIMEQAYTRQRFCSNRCRQKAKYQRVKEERRAASSAGGS